MLYWSFVFLIITIIVAIFGFGGFVVHAGFLAKWLVWVFLGIFIVTFIIGLKRKGN